MLAAPHHTRAYRGGRRHPRVARRTRDARRALVALAAAEEQGGAPVFLLHDRCLSCARAAAGKQRRGLLLSGGISGPPVPPHAQPRACRPFAGARPEEEEQRTGTRVCARASHVRSRLSLCGCVLRSLSVGSPLIVRLVVLHPAPPWLAHDWLMVGTWLVHGRFRSIHGWFKVGLGWFMVDSWSVQVDS